MPTLEGVLVTKWRESLGLGKSELQEACPKKLARNRVHQVENGKSSTSVATLLNIIRGLEIAGRIPFPKDDRKALTRFFDGPDLADARRRLAASAREVAKLAER